MKQLPYYIASIAFVAWYIALFEYHAGPIVHVLLVICLLGALWLGLMQWKKLS